MQCGGNRRAALNAHSKTQGLAWDVGAISTAKWSGARLRDVLADQYGIRTLEDAARMGVKHVHFLPFDPPYDASIPIEKALDARMDVILAYEMNGVEIPPEHGYPVRVVVPGGIGARNVKWCQTIRVASEESDSVWQRNVQYKGFSPNVKKFDETVDVKGALSVQEMPVQSAVTSCASEVEPDDDEMEVQGYAWSGGGRNIVRVDVTSDGEWFTGFGVLFSERTIAPHHRHCFRFCYLDVYPFLPLVIATLFLSFLYTWLTFLFWCFSTCRWPNMAHGRARRGQVPASGESLGVDSVESDGARTRRG